MGLIWYNKNGLWMTLERQTLGWKSEKFAAFPQLSKCHNSSKTFVAVQNLPFQSAAHRTLPGYEIQDLHERWFYHALHGNSAIISRKLSFEAQRFWVENSISLGKYLWNICGWFPQPLFTKLAISLPHVACELTCNPLGPWLSSSSWLSLS